MSWYKMPMNICGKLYTIVKLDGFMYFEVLKTRKTNVFEIETAWKVSHAVSLKALIQECRNGLVIKWPSVGRKAE